MTVRGRLEALRDELTTELERGILRFWLEHAPDTERGGFVGFMSDDGAVVPDAPKGGILNARILWTFSAAWRALEQGPCRAAAERAAEYVQAHFLDPEHGGVYWMVDAAGRPLDARKHVYAQAFAIYGLAEHYRATGHGPSLAAAGALYELIERHASEPSGGYYEAFARDWRRLDDVRLSEDDPDERRSMNTHLHVLEAYANLYRAAPDADVLARIAALVELFLDRIYDPAERRLHQFFDDDWAPRRDVISYGHDIEASWLVLDAAEITGDIGLRGRAVEMAVGLADAVLERGYDPRGGLYNTGTVAGVTDTDKEWWPQAEAIVGFLNAYELTGREEFVDAAVATWAFTRAHIVDATGGDWHRRVSAEGALRPGWEKIGPWKCPYHNLRACLEVMARVPLLASQRS